MSVPVLDHRPFGNGSNSERPRISTSEFNRRCFDLIRGSDCHSSAGRNNELEIAVYVQGLKCNI